MNLWICLTEPGTDVPRPERMAMSGASKTALIILQRARMNQIAPTEKGDETPPKPTPDANARLAGQPGVTIRRIDQPCKGSAGGCNAAKPIQGAGA
jgi:hypothetical protein